IGAPWPAAVGRRSARPAPSRRNTSRSPSRRPSSFACWPRPWLRAGRTSPGQTATSRRPPRLGGGGWGRSELATASGTQGGPRAGRLGWVDGAELCLEPEASYAAAQELARDQGEGLPVQPRTLHRRLHERGLLLAVETHGGKTRFAVRRGLEGRRRAVLCLRADALTPSASAPSAPNDPNTQQDGELHGRTRPDEVRQGGRECANGAFDPAECAAATSTENGRYDGLAHLAHSDTGGGAGPWDDSAAADETSAGEVVDKQQGADWGDWQ